MKHHPHKGKASVGPCLLPGSRGFCTGPGRAPAYLLFLGQEPLLSILSPTSRESLFPRVLERTPELQGEEDPVGAPESRGNQSLTCQQTLCGLWKQAQGKPPRCVQYPAWRRHMRVKRDTRAQGPRGGTGRGCQGTHVCFTPLQAAVTGPQFKASFLSSPWSHASLQF